MCPPHSLPCRRVGALVGWTLFEKVLRLEALGHASARKQWDPGKALCVLLRVRRKTQSPNPHDHNTHRFRPATQTRPVPPTPPPSLYSWPPTAVRLPSTHYPATATAMSAASAGAAPLDLMQILVTIVFPTVGGLLGLALSLYPLLAMPTSERTKSVGGFFNPRPSCVFLCTSILWCIYGAVMGNAFVFCAVRTALLWSDGGFVSFACRQWWMQGKGLGRIVQ